MRIWMENYRGWDIYFNTDSERFYAISDEYDKQSSDRKTYSSAKKYVDDFVKDNMDFVPVELLQVGNDGKYESFRLIGIRKDGHFVREKEGRKSQLPVDRWNISKKIPLNNDFNIENAKEIQRLELKRQELLQAIHELMGIMRCTTLGEIQSKYIKPQE